MDDRMRNSELLPLIRSLVRNRLTKSQAYRALPLATQQQIAHDTVNAIHYIAGGIDGFSRPGGMTLSGNPSTFAPAGALAGETAGGARPLRPLPIAARPVSGGTTPVSTGAQPAPVGGQPRPPAPGLGEAARAGAQAFTEMIAAVNFPEFVGGLIDGVFNSIVTSSIKQMEAYAELVKNVSKSVDQYMKDNVTENHARDYLTERYPDHLELDIGGEKPRVKPKEGYDESNLPDFFADLGLKAPLPSLDEDNVEEELVPAARRRIAMDRQQLLATMVMMGVNRLVVTNGTIEASCFFELDTTDSAKRAATRVSTADWARSRETDRGGEGSFSRTGKGDWKWEGQETDRLKSSSGTGSYQTDYKQSWYSKDVTKTSANFKVTTARTDSDEQTINMHGQLGGKVKVNFKSDYFPLERMVDVLQINQIREKTGTGVPKQALAAPPPTAPALPPLPNVPLPAPAPAPAPALPRA